MTLEQFKKGESIQRSISLHKETLNKFQRQLDKMNLNDANCTINISLPAWISEENPTFKLSEIIFLYEHKIASIKIIINALEQRFEEL